MESSLSTLIAAAERGDLGAAGALFAALYSELRGLAKRELGRHGFVATLGVTTLPRRGRTWLALGACVVVLLACLLLTKSRTGYLATLFGLALIALWAGRKVWLNGKVLLGTVATIAVLVVAAMVVRSIDAGIYSQATKSLGYRFQYWQSSSKMIADHPLFGVGPGDPELITVKGLKRLQSADAVVYDFLVDERLLGSARKDAELICVGKSSSVHTMKQEEINTTHRRVEIICQPLMPALAHCVMLPAVVVHVVFQAPAFAARPVAVPVPDTFRPYQRRSPRRQQFSLPATLPVAVQVLLLAEPVCSR